MIDDERRERFAALGRKGGRANAARHTPEHFREIGRKGGRATSERHGPDFYHAIGTKGGARLKALVEAGKAIERE